MIINNNFEGIEYIIENGGLYFDVGSIACLSDANEETVRRNCKEVLGEYMEQVDFSTNMWKSLYIEKKTGGRPKRFYIHYIVGDVLHRLKSPRAIKFRIWANDKTFKQTNSLEVEAKNIITYLQNKVIHHTTEAFKLMPNKKFQYHLDKANKYTIELRKRQLQLNNINNCNKRLRNELQLNKRGILTETTNKQVFLPETQTRLV